ncbi:MAG TPA: DUF72 domain-containing protein [Actinomycetales bacterium]
MPQDPPGDVRTGISGWTYRAWRGTFYPPGLRQRDELAHAATHLRSIELNGSFYSLQKPSSYQRWHDETPDDFVFSVKAPRFVTHMKRLLDVRTPVANFMASGVLALGRKLGPVLWQLPPTLDDRLEPFLAMLPRTTAQAAVLATEHDARLDDRSLTTCVVDLPLRHALEVRHPSFETPALVDLLRAHDVALVRADAGGRWPELDDVTAGFVYLRLHGAEELYASGYDDPALDAWADRIAVWRSGGTPTDGRTLAVPADRRPREVFAYFDNDIKVRAPFDAMALASRLA